VGSIGTLGGDPYFAGTVKAIRIGSGGVYPTSNSGSLSDGTYDLGASSARFKDLYLSGTIEIENGTGNVGVGKGALSSNTGSNNTAVGHDAGLSNTTSSFSTYVGYVAGENTTGEKNTFLGQGAGSSVTTGADNTIIGRYNGNQGGFDIRTSSNNIVLSDGDGNPRLYFIGATGSGYIKNSVGANPVLQVGNTSNTSGDFALTTLLGANAINTSSYQIICGQSAGSDKFYVYGNGNVVNINNSYGAISDIKLKENIVDASSQWDDIKALTVRKYSMKEDNLDTPNMLGVIAQEVEAAGMGGLVFESPDRQNEGETVKQVNYSILYMKAVKALQEAMDRIETLEAKVTALENA